MFSFVRDANSGAPFRMSQFFVVSGSTRFRDPAVLFEEGIHSPLCFAVVIEIKNKPAVSPPFKGEEFAVVAGGC